MTLLLDERTFTHYLTQAQIEATTQELADRLNADYKDQPVLLICVLKGAIVFTSDLIRKLHMPTDIEFVRLSSYGKEKTSSGTVSLIKDIQTDIKNKNVLIIEEIIDSGRTLRFLYDRLKKSEPKSLEIVTLLDKKSKRVVEVPVKYIGKDVGDQFLVGYGLDLEEKCRNLSDIYFLKYPN